MTSAFTTTHACGLSYRDLVWCAWVYPRSDPNSVRAFVAHERDRAIAKCAAASNTRVGEALARLDVPIPAPRKRPDRAVPEAWKPRVPRLPPRKAQAATQAANNPTKYAPGTVWGNLRITGAPVERTTECGKSRRYWPCECLSCGATWWKLRAAFCEAAGVVAAGKVRRCGRCPDARGKRK